MTHQFAHPLFPEHFVGRITGFPDPVGADDDDLTRGAMGSPVGTVGIIIAQSQRDAIALEHFKVVRGGVVEQGRVMTGPHPLQLPGTRREKEVKQGHELPAFLDIANELKIDVRDDTGRVPGQGRPLP